MSHQHLIYYNHFFTIKRNRFNSGDDGKKDNNFYNYNQNYYNNQEIKLIFLI